MMTPRKDGQTPLLAALGLLVMLTSGCISIDTDLQLPDDAVKPQLTGQDCVNIAFGIGIGNVRMREAMQTGATMGRQTTFGYVYEKQPPTVIRRVHSVTLKEFATLGFGSRCLEVKGEP